MYQPAVRTGALNRLVITIALLFIASLSVWDEQSFPNFYPKKHALNLCRTPVVIPSHLNIICIQFVLGDKIDKYGHSNKDYDHPKKCIFYNFSGKNVVFLCP